ncbi:MAG: metallophosphoesterase [archaeon]
MLTIYTSDIHGNELQYNKLVDYAISNKAELVIIGGDIAPKRFPRDKFIEGQADFLRNRLPELLLPLKKNLPNTKLFLMGNDDCKVNLPILEERKDLFEMIHGKRLKLNNDFDIAGYSYVPISPFGIKDWEKYDFSNVPKNLEERYDQRKNSNYRLNGVKSTNNGWRRFTFSEKTEKRSSIQKDLEKRVFTTNPEKTIYVVHTPPDNTYLDYVYASPSRRLEEETIIETMAMKPNGKFFNPNTQHVGSIALRSFIENHQPYLTLHGHIHETVDISGEFKDHIGKTLCMAPGNDNFSKNLAMIVFDVYNPKEAERIVI